MEYRGEIEIDGEKVIFLGLTKEDENLARRSGWHAARIIERDAACDFGADDESVSFDSITPEDIIGPRVFDRDWTERLPREKPLRHLHVSFEDWQGVICAAVHADTEEEAACDAISDALGCLENVLLEGVECEDGDERYERVLSFLSHLSAGSYCIHYPGEQPCSDGCAKARVTRLS